jgi:NhaP-type Na+/H+ and K+/H+ antiporter
VAGVEENTSIAFGYAAESYVDFGVPLMFLPVLAYGFLMGMAYHGLLRLIRRHELAIASVTVIFWLSLYLFERSWANMLGLSLTLIVYLGGATFLADRLLWGRAATIRASMRERLVEPGSRSR